MSNHREYEARLPLARRKEILLVQGAMYRAGLSEAKHVLQEKLQAESLAQNVIRSLAVAAFAAFKSRGNLGGIGLRTVIPLVVAGFSAISKKGRLKQVLRGVVVAGVVGIAAGFMVKRKHDRKAMRHNQD